MKSKNEKNQTVKVNTNKQSKKIEAVIKASRFVIDGEFVHSAKAYRDWKKNDNAGYQRCGEGSANLRNVEMRFVSGKGIVFGNDTVITVDKAGYGYLFGKKLNDLTIATGNAEIKLRKNQIVKWFKAYSEAVKFVDRTGEKNVKRCEQFKALSNGGSIAVFSNGKRLSKVNGSNGTGRYAEFLNANDALENSQSKR